MPEKTRKVAILCSGLDRVLRGYESHTRRLFDNLRADARPGFEFTLYKRSGAKAPGEIRLFTPFRHSIFNKILGKLRGGGIYWEYVLFAIAFLLRCFILRKKYDRIVTIEPIVSKVVRRLRWMLPGNPTIVMTHTVWNKPEENIHSSDDFHEVNIENFKAMQAFLEKNQIRGRNVWLIPHFIPAGDMQVKETKEELRKKFGIHTRYALLSVGVIKSDHKRMDYLIREAAKLPEDWTLVLCGKAEEPALQEEARRLLGDRYIHLSLPLERMPEAYFAADLFALASTQEGFGIVTIEAMSMGLPAVLHDRELFRWILQDDDCVTDMTREDALSEWILRHAEKENYFSAKGADNHALSQHAYTWEAVREKYYGMYQ